MPSRYRTSDDLVALRTQVADLAQAHGGVFRRSDLREWGVDESVVSPMVRRKMWIRLHHGIYVDTRRIEPTVDPAARHLVDCAAAIRALAAPAFAFGATAAALHGLPVQRGTLNEVHLIRPMDRESRSLRRRVRRPSAIAPTRIRRHTLTEADTTVLHGIPTVQRDMAAVTGAARFSKEWALALLDAVAWQRPDSLGILESQAQRWSHLRGIGTVRSVLPMVRCGAQTPLESLSRFRLLAEGLPEPQLQWRLEDSAGLIGFCDMVWLDLGVVGEADGMLKYATRDDLIREKEREDRIRALGFVVVRWTWREITTDAAAVARKIRFATHSARSRAA